MKEDILLPEEEMDDDAFLASLEDLDQALNSLKQCKVFIGRYSSVCK